jgi:flagellar biosynthesis protein FlhF
MMQVKKYRAATTREALEQIKQDLGEDAFVLETRRVKSGGFLGLGAQMQIEISAANPMQNAKNTAEPKQTGQKLHLTESTVAAPVMSEKKLDSEKDKLMSALFSRAEAVEIDKKPSNTMKYGSFLGLEESKFEPVEISSESPRIVHPKKEKVKPIVTEQFAPVSDAPTVSLAPTTSVSAPTENPTTLISNRELELLRAELREVKFSLGAFSNRQNTQQIDQTEVDFEKFGEVFDSPYFAAYLKLTNTGIPREFARRMIAEIIPMHKRGLIKHEDIASKALTTGLPSIIKFGANAFQPSIMALIGPTGVGKTTTIAKLAARIALREHRRVELITLDTYRIAAVEQLKIYAEIIGANCHVVRSVFELDAVLRRLPSEATVLIDTTGKNPHDLADQYELADYLKGREDISKCLAIQATTNFSDGLAAVKKFEMYGADCLTITKLDETTRPGAMVELVAEGLLPLTYLCTGQRVPEDLHGATPEALAARIIHE